MSYAIQSELWGSIRESIEEFDFGNYGLDIVEETKRDPGTDEWILDLATKIEGDWVKHVDGL